jgi:hypothetical protein
MSNHQIVGFQTHELIVNAILRGTQALEYKYFS